MCAILNIAMCWVSAYIVHSIGFTEWYGVPLALTLVTVHVCLLVDLVLDIQAR